MNTGLQIGAAVRHVRSKRYMSQESLAERCEVGKTTVSRIERGLDTNITTLGFIAEGLDIELWRLLRLASKMTRLERNRVRQSTQL